MIMRCVRQAVTEMIDPSWSDVDVPIETMKIEK
jgi:hypothetical protein